MKALSPKFDFRQLDAEGVIDFSERRYMLETAGFGRLYADGRQWSGASGREIAALPAERNNEPTPLWLVDLLSGVMEAHEEGTESVGGTPYRRFAAKTDLSRVSRETPGSVAVPKVAKFDELLAFPLEVWIDESHVGRIRAKLGVRTETLELWDFGTPVDELDWARLPGGQ